MWALALTLAALQIDDGGGDCPSAAAVEQAFRAVAPENGSSETSLNERFEVRPIAGGVRLRLIDGSGAQLAERVLPGSDCAELARAAAVVLAAWRTEVAAATPKLDLKPPPSPPPPPPPRPKAMPPRWEIGGGFLASFAPSATGSFAAGGDLNAAVGSHRWLLRLDAFGLSLRNISVGRSAGVARFTRAGLAAGPMVRFHPRRWLLDLHAELSFALLYLDAVGFTSNQSANAFDLGIGGGARAALHFSHTAPYVGIGVVGWPLGQSVVVSGPAGGSAAVPAVEIWLQTGVAFGHY